MVHSHDGVSFSHNQERNDAICSSLDGPRDYHSKYSKSDKHHTISLIGGKKNVTNAVTKRRITGIENKLMVPKGSGVGDG